MTRKSPSPGYVEQTVLSLLSGKDAAKSISPTAAAQAVAGDDANWQSYPPVVRRAAIVLAQAGQVVILRKGKPADPEHFRGVYRIATALKIETPNDAPR